MVKTVIKSIQPLAEEELEKDLRFLFHNRSDTADQFIGEAIPIIKYYLNQAMSQYQEDLVNDLSLHLKNEVIGVIMRNKRETVVEDHPPMEDDNDW